MADTVTLTSITGETFALSKKSCRLSKVITNILDDDDGGIVPVAHSNDRVAKLVEFLTHYEDSDPAEIKRFEEGEYDFSKSVPEWDFKFSDMPLFEIIDEDLKEWPLFMMLNLADEMGVTSMIQLFAAKIASIMHPLNVPQIRETFKLKANLTPAEIEEYKKRHPWVDWEESCLPESEGASAGSGTGAEASS